MTEPTEGGAVPRDHEQEPDRRPDDEKLAEAGQHIDEAKSVADDDRRIAKAAEGGNKLPAENPPRRRTGPTPS